MFSNRNIVFIIVSFFFVSLIIIDFVFNLSKMIISLIEQFLNMVAICFFVALKIYVLFKVFEWCHRDVFNYDIDKKDWGT